MLFTQESKYDGFDSIIIVSSSDSLYDYLIMI